MAAVCPHVRNGGLRAAIAGAVLCGVTPSAAVAAEGATCQWHPYRALHPWSRWQHLKSTLGTPLKCPWAQGAQQGDVVQTQLGDQGALKNVKNKGFFLEKKSGKKGGGLVWPPKKLLSE